MLHSKQTCMALAKTPSTTCAGKKRKHYEWEHMEFGCMDVETEIDRNNYWIAFSGAGQVHKFFVYVRFVDEDNMQNVFYKYVDSTLSIKSLKQKILMHENKNLKTRIRMHIKIDKDCSIRKRIDFSDVDQHNTKPTKSLQDVITKFDTGAFTLDANMMFTVVINWSTHS